MGRQGGRSKPAQAQTSREHFEPRRLRSGIASLSATAQANNSLVQGSVGSGPGSQPDAIPELWPAPGDTLLGAATTMT